MKKVLATAVFALITTQSASGQTVTKSFAASEVKSVEVTNQKGKIAISAASIDQATVNANKISFENGCELKIEIKGSTLVARVTDEAAFKKANCEVNLDLQVPRQTSVDVKNGSGSIHIKGLSGQISYKIGSGDVNMEGDVTKLEGKSGSGMINVAGLAGDADLKTGSGEVTVTLAKSTASSRLSVKSGSGDTTVFVPADMKVKTDFKAGIGKLSNELGDAPAAPISISVNTGIGNLAVKKAP